MNSNKEAQSVAECQPYLTPGEFLDGLRSVADSRRRFNLFFYDDADPDCGSRPKKNSGDEFFEEWERREDEVEAMARQHAGRLAQTRAVGIVLPMDELACAHELDDLDCRIVGALLVHCTALNADGGWRGLTCGRIARTAADWDGSVAQSCLPRLLPDGRLAKSGIVVFRRNGPAVGGWMVGLADEVLLRLVGSVAQLADSHTPIVALPGDIIGYLASAGVELTSETAATIKAVWGRIAHGDIIGEKWGFGKLANLPSGLCVLFHGPSGTGKTLAAKHIGMALGRVVRIISATDVMDKYVGETQRNLRDIFQEAERDGDILLFDEADALFGRRGDVSRASERLFNAEINSALIDLERFSGICFMTTNHPDLLDPAVLRRIRHKVFFGQPDAQVRAEIWRKHLPKEAPLAPDVDLGRLAQEFKLTGGQIANAVMSAASLAASRLQEDTDPGQIMMADFEAAAQREQNGYAEEGSNGRLGF